MKQNNQRLSAFPYLLKQKDVIFWVRVCHFQELSHKNLFDFFSAEGFLLHSCFHTGLNVFMKLFPKIFSWKKSYQFLFWLLSLHCIQNLLPASLQKQSFIQRFKPELDLLQYILKIFVGCFVKLCFLKKRTKSFFAWQGSYRDCEKLCGNVNCLFPRITCVRNKKLKWFLC